MVIWFPFSCEKAIEEAKTGVLRQLVGSSLNLPTASTPEGRNVDQYGTVWIVQTVFRASSTEFFQPSGRFRGVYNRVRTSVVAPEHGKP